MRSNGAGKQNNYEQILNESNDIAQQDLSSCNLKSLSAEQLQGFNNDDVILNGQTYIHVPDASRFVARSISLYPNILVITGAKFNYHLVLSNCTISKISVDFKENQIHGFILINNLGNTFCFFDNYVGQTKWYNQVKLYCQLQNFLGKFKLGDKLFLNFYKCQNKQD